MNIDKTIAKLELKHMLEELLDLVDYPISAELADARNWSRKNLRIFCSYTKALLLPCSRICFWIMRPNISEDVVRVDFYELKDGYAEIKTLHSPDYDENEADHVQSIDEDYFFFTLRRAIIYGLFFFPPEHCYMQADDQHPDASFIPMSKNSGIARLMLQLLGVNT